MGAVAPRHDMESRFGIFGLPVQPQGFLLCTPHACVEKRAFVTAIKVVVSRLGIQNIGRRMSKSHDFRHPARSSQGVGVFTADC